MPQSDHLTFARAKELARTAGARDLGVVTTHLVHCTDEADAANSIAALRRNRPEYFRRARQGRAR
jgi:ribonuclease BN (tRNA processing enzyme)